MDKKTVGLSDTLRNKTAPKSFTKNPIQGTKFTIAISSAKGGVGKSTFATNLALALKFLNHKVGILDADIYGPSLPKMMAINEKPKSEDGKSLTPIEQYGIQCISIGFLDCPMNRIYFKVFGIQQNKIIVSMNTNPVVYLVAVPLLAHATVFDVKFCKSPVSKSL